VHEFLDPQLPSTLRARFAPTHDLTVIRSVDDLEKARTYSYDELAGYDLQTRKVLLGEVRPAAMEWFVLTPRRG
jgi:hypothetical protein